MTQLAAIGAVAAVMTALDLVWLGVVARSFYDGALGPLKRDPVHWPAAAAFYVFYVAAIVLLCVLPPAGPPVGSVRDAAVRGAVLGLVAYGTMSSPTGR